MKFKLDENFGPTVRELFVRRRHDCLTVIDEALGGALDAEVLKAAVAEDRILVTMDHDFGNVLIYPPQLTSGIAVISPQGRASKAILTSMIEAFLSAAEARSPSKRLWIVEPSRIREHDPTE